MQAVPGTAGEFGCLQVVGGTSESRHGERAESEELGGGETALLVGRSGELAEENAEAIGVDVGAGAGVEEGQQGGAVRGQTGVVQRLLVLLVDRGLGGPLTSGRSGRSGRGARECIAG